MTNEIGLNRITPSMLLEYESCPRLFYYRSFLGLQMPQTKVHFEFGSAIHAAIDNIYEQYDNEDGWKLAEIKIIKDIFKSKFTLDSVDEYCLKEGDTRESVYEDMLADGLAILKDFWEKKEELRTLGVNPTTMELVVKCRVFNPETDELLPLPVSGRIDGINEPELKITEFKTSAKKYDPIETRNSPQSLMYTWMMFCQTGKIHTVDYVVMLKKKKSDRIQHIPLVYEMADILAFDKRVRSIIEKIRNREFDRPLKNHPPYCECKKFEELLELDEKYA